MIELALACLALLIIIFLFNVYRTMFLKPNENTIATWKTGLFLIILSSLLFFTYLTLTIGSVGIEQTINDGTTNFVVQSNDYMQSFNLMPLASAVFLFQWLFFAIEVLRGISFFGRGRLDANSW